MAKHNERSTVRTFFISDRLMCTYLQVFFSGPGIKHRVFDGSVGQRNGSHARVAKNIAQYVPGIQKSFFSAFHLIFSSGCHSSTISKHHWQCKPGCLQRQGVGSVLSFWRQFSIFLQFRLQVFSFVGEWLSCCLLAEITYIYHLDAQILSCRPD